MKFLSFFSVFGFLICVFALQTSAQIFDFRGKNEIQIPRVSPYDKAARQRALVKTETLPVPETNLLPPPKTAGENLAPQVGSVDPSFAGNITDGTATVNSVFVQADGKIIVGGFFSSVNGAARRGLERLNADGTRDATFNPVGEGANGTVYVIVPLPAGKFLIGGAFTTYNGNAAGRIARINADGTLDTSFSVAGANTSIHDLVIQPDGKILISGNFTAFNGTPRNRVARLNPDGSLDTAFNPNVNGFTEEIVLQADGKIVIGGTFTTVGGTARNGIARLNSDGTVDATFDPGTGVRTFSGDVGGVYGMQLQADGKILIGGDFDYYGVAPLANLARINTDGSPDLDFAPWTGQTGVEFFAVQPDGKILVAGDYRLGSIRYALVRLNADGTNDENFAPAPLDDLGYVVTAQADGKIILGGYFADGVKRFNADGTVDAAFEASVKIEATVRALAIQPDGKILVAGDFRLVNGAARRNIARLNPDGTLDAAFNPGFGADNAVYAVALQADGKIIIGGQFLSYNRTDRNLVARLNPNGTLDSSFDFRDGQGVVYDVKVQADGKILLGGYFGGPETQISTGFVRLTSGGAYDSPAYGFFGTNAFVTDIEPLPDGKYLIAGNFTLYGSTPRNRIARVNGDLSLDPTFNPGTGANQGTIWDVAPLADGRMYIAGSFTNFDGNAIVQDVARLSPDGTLDPSFISGVGFNGSANVVLPLADGTVLVGGTFYSYKNFPTSHLAEIDQNGSLKTAFNLIPTPDPFYFVWDLASQADGKILVGGRFDMLGGSSRNSIIRLLAAPRKTPFDFDGDGQTDIGITRHGDVAGREWWYRRSSDQQTVALPFGNDTDVPVPADFTGDGKTDLAFWRPASGEWFVLRSEDNTFFAFPFGASGDIPVPADFDGDGRDDPGVFRPSNGTWYIQRSSGGTLIRQFAAASDRPVVADYDGDRRADLAVFRPSGETGAAEWWYVRSSDGQTIALPFGASTDRAVPADYTGDGRADIAFFRPSTGEWFVLRSEDNTFYAFPFGATGDVPAPGDYDGDGRIDPAVFRPSQATWYVQRSTAGTLITAFGAGSDVPVPSVYVP